MATIDAETEHIGTSDDRVAVTTWETFATNGDVGEAITRPATRDLCVQFSGTWGTGGTMLLQGSNDNVTWFTLNDTLGTAISKTADALEQVLETPRYLRPKLSAGTGTIDIDVILIQRRGFR